MQSSSRDRDDVDKKDGKRCGRRDEQKLHSVVQGADRRKNSTLSCRERVGGKTPLCRAGSGYFVGQNSTLSCRERVGGKTPLCRAGSGYFVVQNSTLSTEFFPLCREWIFRRAELHSAGSGYFVVQRQNFVAGRRFCPWSSRIVEVITPEWWSRIVEVITPVV